MLFDLWNAFENRLPASFLQAKILEVGDLLFSVQVILCKIILYPNPFLSVDLFICDCHCKRYDY